MWTTLQNCHQCQGMVFQIQLIPKGFSIQYSTSIPFSTTSEQLQNLNDCIWAMDAHTSDNFLVILMLLTLSGSEFSGICDAIVNGLSTSTSASPYTIMHILYHSINSPIGVMHDALAKILVSARGRLAKVQFSSGSTTFEPNLNLDFRFKFRYPSKLNLNL